MSKIINGPRYAAFIVLCAIVVSPALLVDIPAMADYPQHLARMHILATAGTPTANPFYDVTWKFYPNLAMELLVPALASILSVEAATKAFLILSQILIVTGAMALEAIVKGRQQLAALAALALLYSFPFAWGFLNFQFGMGVALWGITAWVAMANRDIVQRFAVHTMFATALYTAHFFAFGIYGAVIGFYELWQFNERRDVRKAAWTVAVLANPLVLMLVAFGLYAGGGYESEWNFAWKLITVLHSLSGYNLVLSSLAVNLTIAATYLMHRRGNLKITSPGIWIAVGLALTFLAMPFRLSGAAFADVRVLVAAALILPAFITTGAVSFVTQCAIALFALVNAVHVASIWLPYKEEYARIKASFALIELGSSVLVGHSGDGGNPPRDLTELPIHHAPVLAVHYAKALVPSLAAFAGIQPVKLHTSRRDFAVLSPGHFGPVPITLLRAIADGLDSPAIPQHIRRWNKRYQYIYLVGPPIANPLPDHLVPIADGARFALYRIKE